MKSAYLPRVFGIAALFSGCALLANILADFSLSTVLLIAGAGFAGIATIIWVFSPPSGRRTLVVKINAGLLSGVLATAIYDLSKYLLSLLDASDYNPFEAIRVFGLLLVGSSGSEAAIITAGTAYHVLNGVTFAIAYCFLFGIYGVVAGILWSLFLEVFQLALYPGWLDVRAYQEFVQISFLSHVFYGATLGLVAKRMLQRHETSTRENQ